MSETEAGKNNDSAPDTGAQPFGAPNRARPRRYRKRWVLKAFMTGFGGLVTALLVGFLLLVGRDLRAPDWVQQEVELRLAEAVPDLDIRIGQISLRVEPSDLSPRVALQNVSILDDTGLPFASLTELSVRASFRAALQGKLLPKKISLSGALIKLRRASDGSFDLTIGSALQSSNRAPTLAELVDDIDGLLVQPELRRLTDLQADALTVLYEDARAGRAWTVDGGTMRLQRTDNNLSLAANFALLGGQDYATTLELSYDSAIGSRAARVGLILSDAPSEDISSQTPAMAWMQPLRAPISGAVRTQVDANGTLGTLNASLQIGSGVVQPETEAKPIPFDGAQAYFEYDPLRQSFDFSQLAVSSEWINVTAQGKARLGGLRNGWPTAITAQLQLDDVSANPFGLYSDPVTLKRAAADLRINLDPFALHLGQLALEEAGQVIVAEGRADVSDQGWHVSLDAHADRLVVGEVLKVWPETLKTNTRKWIADNVLEGQVSDARFALRLEPDEKPDVYLDLAFDDATVRFMKTLPPLSRARGKASLIGQRFLAVAERGTVQAPQGGALRVDGTSFEIANTRIKGGPAQVQLTAKGSVTSALSLLDQEPFRFLSKAGQTPDLAKGQADISGVIDFALKRPLPPSEIGFDIAGTVTDVRSETLVPGRPITADKLVFRAEPKRVRVSGAGRIDTVAFNGAWNMPIGQPGAGSEVTGQVELSQRFVERFNIGLPKGVVSGQTQGDITLSLTRDAPVRFAMTSNLDGLGLRFDPLGFRLGAGTRGALSVRGTLGTAEGTPPKIERITLDAPGLRAEGAVQINSGGTLDAARFDRVRAGDWLDGAVTLNGRGRNKPPAIVVSGGSVDLRKLPQSGGGGSGGSIGEVPLQVQLDQLQITQGIALNQFQGAFTLRGGGVTGGFTGRLNGTALVQGQTEARGARTAVQVTSGDAGRAISAAGFLKNAKDGAMVLDLAPADGAGSYNGRLEITNMRLREPPQALALLSVASGIGLLEQLDGKGLMFNEVSSRFRITPQTVIVSEGSAVGPSIGLSVDGYYDVASKNVDMQGVVSPLYALNAIGSIFTRKGEGLIGFNYTLKGLAANPRVQVNPLSLFTPGMFREIFRRPPPDLSQ